MSDLQIKLLAKGLDETKFDETHPFLGYQLCLQFDQAISSALTSSSKAQSQLFASAEPNGKLHFVIPDKIESLANVTISIFAPDGELLHREYRSSISKKTADQGDKSTSSDTGRGERSKNEFQPIQITVESLKSYATLGKTNGHHKEEEKLRVRVITQDAAPLPNKQVAFFGVPDGSSSLLPLCVGTTDQQGCFSCEYPKGKFLNVEARIPGAANTSVQLRDGRFPKRLLLSVVVPLIPCAEKKPDCGCEPTTVPRLPDLEDFIESPGTYSSDMGLGECVNFTKPNRVQEEFDYYALVRTTEPAIRGLTVDSTIELPAEEISKLIDKARRPFKEIERLLSGTKRELTADGKAARSNPHPAASTSARKPSKSSQAHAQQTDALEEALEQRKEPDLTKVFNSLTVSPAALKDLSLSGRFDFTSLAHAHEKTILESIEKAITLSKKKVTGRAALTPNNTIDWDDDPTFYEACSIAHGHILHLKQTWRADGYSLGDLLYSMPLAPGQRRQIAVLDWERRETASRGESLEVQEELAASLSRDRDISEIVSGNLGETTIGTSLALTGSTSKGSGASGSFLPNIATSVITSMGSSAGIGGGASVGFQKGAREVSANALQRVRDKTLQSASAVRAQRSTVVQTVAQGETMRAQTEVVANYNHCHAITMQYFEVLRHFAVDHTLSSVQECLFVPLPMSMFDCMKALRWQTALTVAIADRRMLRGFDALQRIDSNYENSDLPDGSYADDSIEALEGYIKVRFRFARPRDRRNDRAFEEDNWQGIEELTGLGEDFWESHIKNAQNKDAVFIQRVGPVLASELTNRLKLSFRLEQNANTPISIDLNLQSAFKNDSIHHLVIHGNFTSTARRKSVTDVSLALDPPSSGGSWQTLLPPGTQMILDSAQIRYRTRHYQHDLVSGVRVQGNLLDKDGVSIRAPLSREELVNPKKEDRDLAQRLLQHLNENLEFYHRAIWLRMDPQRRYMLLDGIQAPNSHGRSVASVVENRIVGIVGNSLVLPVVPGIHLDPTYSFAEGDGSDKSFDLTSHYIPSRLAAPTRITVPTRGVYAECVMGACNSCEKKDETRFWRWEESPIPDALPQIQPLSTESRRFEPPNLTAKDLPQPIINLQNAPTLPDPSGFSALANLLGKSDSFRDLTGLSENQKNALAALQSSFGSSNAFAAEAAKVAMHEQLVKNMGPIKEVIKEGVSEGLISQEGAQKSFENLSRQITGGDDSSSSLANSLGGALNKIVDAVGGVAKEVTGTLTNKDGNLAFSAKGDLKLDQKVKGATTLARILLPQEAADKDLNKLRAFNPFDKSGEVTLQVQANSSTPPDAFLRLEIARVQPYSEIGDLKIEDLTPASKLSKKFRLSAVIPGQIDLECLLLQRVESKTETPQEDNGQSTPSQSISKKKTETIVLQSIIIPFSVPKYYRVTELPVFDTFLGQFPTSIAGFTLLDIKEQLIVHIKESAEFVLQTANVRLIWELGASPDPAPTVMNTIYNPGMINLVTIENTQPAFNLIDGTPIPAGTRLGNTGAMRCQDIPVQLNTPIRIWPGGLIAPANNIEIDPEMLLIVQSVTTNQMSEPEQLLVTAKIVGRYIGETIAHEIGHSLIGCIESSGITPPPAHATVGVMRDAPNRPVIDRTGIDANSSTEELFPTAATAPDLGLSRINKFDVFSQSEIDSSFPVIPFPMTR